MSWETVGRVAEFCLGLALLSLPYCLYESEEGRLQDALVEVWLRILDRASSTRKRFERLLAETAKISLRLLDLVFGRRSLSLQAISVSFVLVFASTLLTFPFWVDPMAGPQSVLDSTTTVLIFAAFAPAIIQRPWALLIPLAIFLLLHAVLFSVSMALIRFTGPEAVIDQWFIAYFAVALDLLWLALIRRGIKWASKETGIWRHALVILGGAIVSLVFILFFPLPGHGLERATHTAETVQFVIWALPPTRVFIVLVGVIQLLVLLSAFTHWIVWPVLSRVVYATERYKFFRNRKLFGILGGLLLLDACKSLWLAKVVTATVLHK
jgi:hypothetical protein